MNVVVTADPHGCVSVVQAFVEQCNSGQFDVGVVAGDVTECQQWNNNNRNAQYQHTCEVFSMFNQSQVPVVVVQGNHDRVGFPDMPNVHNVHGHPFVYQNVTFVGFGFWGRNYDMMVQDFESVYTPVTFFVTHEPCFVAGQYVACSNVNFNSFVDQYHPDFHVFGHAHQAYGSQGNSINAAFPNAGHFWSVNTDTGEVDTVPCNVDVYGYFQEYEEEVS